MQLMTVTLSTINKKCYTLLSLTNWESTITMMILKCLIMMMRQLLFRTKQKHKKNSSISHMPPKPLTT